jgi:hypothetical protein
MMIENKADRMPCSIIRISVDKDVPKVRGVTLERFFLKNPGKGRGR